MTTTTDRSELLAQLSEGIANLTTSDEWQRYLDCKSRFYRYSPNNVILIAQQRHEASCVAGFNAWKKMGRFVRKGEKAIWILAPMVYKQTDEKTDEEHKVIRGFKFVPVFDIASTDGEDLPTIVNPLTGDEPSGLFSRLIEVAHSIGFTVKDAEFSGSVNGDCSHSEYRIRVEITNSPAQRVKTLAHEIGHALLHEKYDNRALAELEAESTAYVICQALGLDTGDYFLRVRRNLGRWWRPGHRWDQGIARAHPESCGHRTAVLRGRTGGGGVSRPSVAQSGIIMT